MAGTELVVEPFLGLTSKVRAIVRVVGDRLGDCRGNSVVRLQIAKRNADWYHVKFDYPDHGTKAARRSGTNFGRDSIRVIQSTTRRKLDSSMPASSESAA